MMCEISLDISRYPMRSSICQISAHCTTPCLLLAVRRFKSPGLSKNEISSLLLLLLPDLIWSLEIISNALTLLSRYVNIIANYFLAPCTFYFRLKIEFVFRKSEISSLSVRCSPSHGNNWVISRIKVDDGESQWWSICWEQAITSPRTVMLCCHSLLSLSSLNLAEVCSYKVYCSVLTGPRPGLNW